MDYNKVYKVLYLYHEEGYGNLKRIAGMTKLHYTLVEKIIKGDIFSDVLEQYKQDEATGKFDRTYSIPPIVKLNEEQYDSLKHEYIQELLLKKKTIDDIRCSLIIKDIHNKQAEKMIEELTYFAELTKDYLERKMADILKVLELPEKWSIGDDGYMINIYPHPVLTDDYKVKSVEYKPYKSFLMPEALWEMYIIKEEKEGVNRKPQVSTEVIEEWKQMRNEGITCKEIARIYKVSLSCVSYNTNIRKQNE